MVTEVIKKDGTRQPFDPDKIKNAIRAASARTSLSEDKKNEVVGRVSSAVIQMANAKEEISTSEIKEKILAELDILEPSVSEEWRNYDAEKQ